MSFQTKHFVFPCSYLSLLMSFQVSSLTRFLR
nr:MAG TPA: hypothetical protein [Bacteriophage sp.]